MVAGLFATSQVSVNYAITIGEKQQKDFEKVLPEGFWDKIKKKMQTIEVTKMGMRMGPSILCDIIDIHQ